jgi:hypothetical protein
MPRKSKTQSYPMRYVPAQLSESDKAKQARLINRSKNLYSRKIYYTRPKIATFKSKPSHHVATARKIYGVDTVVPNATLSRKTGCSINGLKQIVRKGEGAYFSSGSRPNQTAKSWGIARLASALTAGKSASIDYHIIDKECNHKGKAYRLATRAIGKYGRGHRQTRKYNIQI